MEWMDEDPEFNDAITNEASHLGRQCKILMDPFLRVKGMNESERDFSARMNSLMQAIYDTAKYAGRFGRLALGQSHLK